MPHIISLNAKYSMLYIFAKLFCHTLVIINFCKKKYLISTLQGPLCFGTC